MGNCDPQPPKLINPVCFRIITLSKVALRLFPIVHALPRVKHIAPGEALYTISLFIGLILWGFAVVWFIIAVMMIAMAGGFPFNMGWWGFIFPIGKLALVRLLFLAPSVSLFPLLGDPPSPGRKSYGNWARRD